MKRILSTLFVVIAFTLMMAIVAQADSVPTVSYLDIAAGTAWDSDVDATPTGPFVVGSEWLQGQVGVTYLDLGSAIPAPGSSAVDRSNILYAPGVSITVGTSVIFRMTGGAIKANGGTYYLWNNNAASECATLIDFTVDGNGNYTMMKFLFVESSYGAGQPSMHVFDTASFVRTPAVASATNKPILGVTYAGLSGNSNMMYIKATEAYDVPGNPIAQVPTPNYEILVKMVDQLSADVRYRTGSATCTVGNATSTINVNATPSRSKFISEGANTDTPNTTHSRFCVQVASAAVNVGIDLSGATYSMTVVGDQTAISGVTLNSLAFTRTPGVSWTIASNFTAADLRVVGQSDVVFTVDGTTPINPAQYYVTLVINAGTGYAAKTVLAGVLADVWTINAMQVRIPYLVIDTRTVGNNGFTSFFEVTNRTTLPASVSIDAIVTNATGTATSTESVANAFTVPANSVLLVSQGDLDSWFASIDNTQVWRVALVLYIQAPVNGADVAAYIISPTSRTATPVLYNTGNFLDDRLWQ